METLTIKINKKSKAGNALISLLESYSDKPGVKIIKEKNDESPYDPEFVKMVKQAAANKKRYEVKDIDQLWESL